MTDAVGDNETRSLSPPDWRGHIDLGGEPVTWRGLTSSYTLGERDLMRSLPVREQAIVHLLKSFTPGEIQESGTSTGETTSQPGSPPGNELDTHRASGEDQLDGLAPQFIHHEDIPFGEEKRKRPQMTYALVWTPAHHKIHKTKAKAAKKTRAWKKWKERQGWKVTSHESGYFAARGAEREAITLHEYDAITRERLK